MRHRHGFTRIGRDARHRNALLKNMAIALVKHERIMTTLAKAKAIRKSSDKLIGLAKRDNEQARKTAWNWLRHPDLMDKLFGSLRERYASRPGGYTRVLKAPNRKGDNAPMAIVELVGNRYPPLRAGRDALRAPLPVFSEADKELLSRFADENDLSSALSGLDLNEDIPELKSPENVKSDSHSMQNLSSLGQTQSEERDRHTGGLGTPV